MLLILKYAGWLLLALLLLLLTVSAADSAAAKLSRLTGLSKKLWAWVVVVVSLLILCTAGALLLWVFLSECRSLLLSATEGRGVFLILINKLIYYIEEIGGVIAPDTGDLKFVSESARSLISQGVTYILSRLGGYTSSLISKVPQLAGAALFFTVCAVWLSVDLDRIRQELCKILPRTLRETLFSVIGSIRRQGEGYVRSHLILFVITLAETYIGLLIMKAPCALALSVIVALIDILPLLGAGAVLLPWAVGAALMGSPVKSLGILALLGLLWVTHQITEPLLVGKEIGIHPFISFVSTFTGLALFGPSGAIILPLAVAILWEYNE